MIPFTEQLLQAARKRNVSLYIVGGFLRDVFLKRGSHDLDLVSSLDPRTIGMDLAEATGGNYYELNLDHSTARVTLDWEEHHWQVDIGVIRGNSIHEDLKNRDFTVNAMALPLEKLSQGSDWQEHLLDPFGGRKDLEKRQLRLVSEEVILDDPLRMVRGIRFASQLQFDLEPYTSVLFKKHRPLLYRVPNDRLKMELGKILANPSVKYLWLMQRLDFIEGLFPHLEKQLAASEARVKFRGWEQSMQTLYHLEKLMEALPFSPQWKYDLEKYLAEELSMDWPRAKILKLAAIFHNIKDAETGNSLEQEGADYYQPSKAGGYLYRFSRRLRLNRAEKNLLLQACTHYQAPLKLYRYPNRTARTLYRFYKTLGNEAPGILLFSLADYLALRSAPGARHRFSLPSPSDYRSFLNSLLHRYFIVKERFVQPPALITREEVLSLLGIEPGPLSMEILEAIAEAQAEGRIKTRKEAFSLAEEEFKNRLANQDYS